MSGPPGLKSVGRGGMKNDQTETPDMPWKPVLGLSDEPGTPLELPVRAAAFFDQPESETLL